MSERSPFLVFLVSACLCLSGCSSLHYARAAEYRAENPYTGDIPAGSGQPGREFFDRRLRDLVIGVEVLSIETDEHGETVVDTAESGEELEYTLRTLTPISADGYALTSLHVEQWKLPADKESLATVLPREPGSRNFGSVRWLWCSAELDLALVDIVGIPVRAFEWAENPAVGDAVYLGGVRLAPARGELLSLEEGIVDDVAFTRFRHNAPARLGDSGGAVVDDEGRLLGITIGTWPGLFRPRDSRTVAVRPDRRKLEAVIARYERDPDTAYATPLEACSVAAADD